MSFEKKGSKEQEPDRDFKVPWETFARNMKFANEFIQNSQDKLPETMKIEVDVDKNNCYMNEVWITCEINGVTWSRMFYVNMTHSLFVEEFRKSFRIIWDQKTADLRKKPFEPYTRPPKKEVAQNVMNDYKPKVMSEKVVDLFGEYNRMKDGE